MTTNICRIQRVIDKLQEIVDEAEAREATEIKTCPNTYSLHEFVSLGSTDSAVSKLSRKWYNRHVNNIKEKTK